MSVRRPCWCLVHGAGVVGLVGLCAVASGPVEAAPAPDTTTQPPPTQPAPDTMTQPPPTQPGPGRQDQPHGRFRRPPPRRYYAPKPEGLGARLTLGASACVDQGLLGCEGLDPHFAGRLGMLWRLSRWISLDLDMTYALLGVENGSYQTMGMFAGLSAYVYHRRWDFGLGVGGGMELLSMSVPTAMGESYLTSVGLSGAVTFSVEYVITRAFALGLMVRYHFTRHTSLCNDPDIVIGQSCNSFTHVLLFGVQTTFYFLGGGGALIL